MKKRNFKFLGGIMVTDSFLGILLVVIIMAAAFMNGDTLLNFGRYGSEWIEMQNVKTAASSYSGLRSDGASPDSMEDLINGVDAADSIDGADHHDLMSAKSGRWKNGTYNDAWGNPFEFGVEDGSRYILSPGTDGTSGTTDDIKVYY